jgi:hypothetical protein
MSDRATTDAQLGSGAKAVFEIALATAPAVLLYFVGWAYLHFYLRAFRIDVSELDLDLQTILIYSFRPLKALMLLYLPVVAAVVLVVWILRALIPTWKEQTTQFYRRLIEAPALVHGLGLFAILAFVAVVSIPTIRSVAAQAANEKWAGAVDVRLPVQVLVKESESKESGTKESNEWLDNYKSCSSTERRGLDLIFADKGSYYLLCTSPDDRTQGIIFEVRRETGLASIRFVDARSGE